MEDNISNLPAYNKPMDNILNDNFSKLDLSTNNESTNNQLTDNQATNNGSTSTQPANNQTTNDPPSGSQSTNNQTINGKEPGKASLVFEINFSKKSDCGASEILENFLFLGAGRDANDLDYIRSKGITHVLCMVSGWKPRVAYSVDFLHLPISDTPLAQIVTLFPKAIEFINNASNSQAKILVHCAAGISRSSTIVLAYLIKSHNMTLRQAYELVYSKRTPLPPPLLFIVDNEQDIIRPNTGFFDQLMEWERTHSGNSTMTHKDLHFIIPRLPRAPVFTPSKTLEIEEGMTWAASVLTDDVLNDVFVEICGGEYVAEKTADFLDKVLAVAKSDTSVEEMKKKGYKWPKLSINLMKTAANWYKAKKDVKS